MENVVVRKPRLSLVSVTKRSSPAPTPTTPTWGISFAEALKGGSPVPLTPPLSQSPPLPPSFPPSPPSPPVSLRLPPTYTPPSSPTSPLPSPTVKISESGWAYAGRLAWLDEGKIGPKSIIRQRLPSEERVRGFENHPVLIWRGPDENGIVKVIPITSYGGHRAEEKWSRMRNRKQRELKLQQLLMLENGNEAPHDGTRTLLFTEQIPCRKRSYLHIEHGIFKLEVNCLTPYTIGENTELALAPSALHYVNYQLNRVVPPGRWVDPEENVEMQVPTA